MATPADLELLDWLRAADQWLAPAQVAELREQVAKNLAAQSSRITQQLKALGDVARPREPALSAMALQVDENSPPKEWSAAKLVLLFAERHPNSRASDFVEYVQRHKGIEATSIYAELYKASRDGGALEMFGKRPNTTYRLRARPLEAAKRRS